MFFLNGLETKESVQELERQQLEGCLWCKSCPNGYKSSPQAQHAVLCDRLGQAVGKTIVDFGVSGLIHEFGTQHVPRCDRDSHEKAGHKGRAKGRADILARPSSGLGDVSLGEIVTSHLGGIQDTSTGNVDFYTTVKSGNALITVHVSDQS